LPQSDSSPKLGSQTRKAKRKYINSVPSIPEESYNDINLLVAPDRKTIPINSLQEEPKKDGYTLVEGVMDSGAAKNVGPRSAFRAKPKPSFMSSRGLKFNGPDGHELPNHGELDCPWESVEGHSCGTTWQLSDVGRFLFAASELTAAGNDIILRKKDGEIRNRKTGKRIHLQKKGGVYVLKMWVANHTLASDFPGQGKA